METRTCKKCFKEKDVKSFAQYTTRKGTKLRTTTCNSCYNNKYHPWVKKPFGVSISDPRFKWDIASDSEKVTHIRKVFENSVIKNDGCWDWKGGVHHSGYIFLKYDGRQVGLHRISWMLHKGELSDDKWILHHCDNRKCSNPEHLYVGTPTDNSNDRELRNRRKKLIGSKHPNAVLTEEKVREIKGLINLGVPLSKLTKKFECSWGALKAIKHGRTWKHVLLASDEKQGVE